MPTERYEEVGWYLVCTCKKIGLEDGRLHCPKSEEHVNNIFHDTKFCGVCGTKLITDKIDRYASFLDIHEEDGYIPVNVASELEDNFYLVPIESVGAYQEILSVTTDGIFNLHVSEDEGMYEIESNRLQLDVKKDKEKIKEKIKPLLEYLYESIEIKFGAVVHFN